MGKFTEEEKKEAYRLTEDPKTHPGDIKILAEYRDYLLYKSNTPQGRPAISCSYDGMQAAYGAWSFPGLVRATRRVIDRAGEDDFVWNVYTDEEIAADSDKADVKLFWFPAGYETDPDGHKALKNADRPFVFAISGGAYTSVCNLAEAFPTAASLNELGVNVLALNYRVNESEPDKITEALFPKPLDDTAAAINFIFSHMDSFGLKNREYIVTGFSAGASLTVQWGLKNHGYAHYGLPRPKAMFPVYPVIDNGMSDPESAHWFNTIMFGPGYEEALLHEYSVPERITSEYPPCYIVHAEDDPVVPVENSKKLHALLKGLNIPCEAEIVPAGGHGFGDGSGTPAAGWTARAMEFAGKL